MDTYIHLEVNVTLVQWVVLTSLVNIICYTAVSFVVFLKYGSRALQFAKINQKLKGLQPLAYSPLFFPSKYEGKNQTRLLFRFNIWSKNKWAGGYQSVDWSVFPQPLMHISPPSTKHPIQVALGQISSSSHRNIRLIDSTFTSIIDIVNLCTHTLPFLSLSTFDLFLQTEALYCIYNNYYSFN